MWHEAVVPVFHDLMQGVLNGIEHYFETAPCFVENVFWNLWVCLVLLMYYAGNGTEQAILTGTLQTYVRARKHIYQCLNMTLFQRAGIVFQNCGDDGFDIKAKSLKENNDSSTEKDSVKKSPEMSWKLVPWTHLVSFDHSLPKKSTRFPHRHWKMKSFLNDSFNEVSHGGQKNSQFGNIIKLDHKIFLPVKPYFQSPLKLGILRTMFTIPLFSNVVIRFLFIECWMNF